MADKSFLDWPFLEPQHRDLAAAVDGWAASVLPGLADEESAHRDLDGACRRIAAALGEAGFLKYCAPAAYGGAHENLDVRALSIIRETLARHAGLADFVFAMQGLGSGAISVYGTDAQKRAYLPAVVAGEKIAAFALSEPEAGSDVAAMTTTLTKDGDAWRVTGEKTWISNGGVADFYTLFAKNADGKSTSAVIVDAASPGLEIAERIDVIAPHPLARLRFHDCRIPAANLLGAEGDGMRIALATLDIFRTTVGAAALGFARRALDEASRRALARKMFGARLADQPIAQALLAEMALDVDAAALLVYRSAWAKDTHAGRVTREAAMAKLFATDRAQAVIDKAVQLFGALGVTKGTKVEELYREIRSLRIYEGASEVQKIVIARQHLQDAAKP